MGAEIDAIHEAKRITSAFSFVGSLCIVICYFAFPVRGRIHSCCMYACSNVCIYVPMCTCMCACIYSDAQFSARSIWPCALCGNKRWSHTGNAALRYAYASKEAHSFGKRHTRLTHLEHMQALQKLAFRLVLFLSIADLSAALGDFLAPDGSRCKFSLV